ncbi:related to cel1 protein precursor [Cephalotrichum gorgonifer]|uniref:lytic cellulose monooxygenase (C4-dehydrogenating) n=1 Tax=Cephalotrichum gorgonifer TaxID=2041049 RepID=A0AAE8SUV8_9PEZI|nr:related to cel1 protein precursor [Cephalotrichum gorgonifer]
MAPKISWCSLALFTARVLAHGGLNNYTVGETWYRGYDPNDSPDAQIGQPWLVQRPWASIDPVFEYDSPHLACNDPGTTAAAYIPIEAGDDITAVYWYWLHPTGPMAVWLAACGDSCEDVDPAEADWFKIWHAGLTDDGSLGLAEATWYQKGFQKWNGESATWPVTIPPSLKPGLYLIRHEIISIHVAFKPQWYPECAHLNITGGGDAMPGEEFLFKFPGAYSPDDPMTFLDIYSEEWTDPVKAATYTPPLGPVWDGGQGVVNKYCLRC